MAETDRAARGWFRERPPHKITDRLADQAAEWDGRGTVGLTATHLEFRGSRRRRTSLRTVAGVARDAKHVWIKRRRAHDWLVRCRSSDHAQRLERMLAARIEPR